ncbi:MAG: LapA family protein [Sphingomonadaceae bacterium]|nr:LapA family protein [Sphingomonadaceae bacterium]
MNVIRTAVWMIITAMVVGFVVLNWGEPQQVKIWPGSAENDFLFEWPVGFMALMFFLAGFVPMWLYHRGVKWGLNRRIAALENAARVNAAVAPAPVPPAAPAEPLTSEESPGA